MATNFPTSLDSLSNPSANDLVENSNAALDHHTQHANANDAIEALEAKVGVNSSGVTTSHDYKLSEVTSTDKAVGKTATQTLTNKTLTSPTLTTPTIASFTNATHTHQNAAGGGTLDAAAIAAGTVATARLGSGSATSSTFLRGDQTWATPAIIVARGSASRDISTASGNQEIAHGLGTIPTFVRITAVLSDNVTTNASGRIAWTTACVDASGQTAVYLFLKSGDGNNSDSLAGGDFAIYVGKTTPDRYVGVVTLDATNITIAWTKTGSPSGTASILWEAIK